MLSGHVQGKFLEFISKLVRPFSILEIGTFTGYSAICLAKGLREGGHLHTIELRDEDADRALENFNKAGMQNRIILHRGNALNIIPELNHEWDLVFIDADKVNYTAYYQLVLPRVKNGGVILADNVLFHGEVLHDQISGKNAKAIHAFNQYVLNDHSVDNLVVTVRDGLLLIMKK
jgi:caffeoyl-CoA O-methyltransferase